MGEEAAFPDQTVQVRRSHMGMTGSSDRIESLLVGHEDEEIGFQARRVGSLLHHLQRFVDSGSQIG